MDKSITKYLVIELLLALSALLLLLVSRSFAISIFAILGNVIFVSAFLLIAFTIFFFRDPTREILENPSAILSPADGKVILVERTKDNEVGDAMRIAIFMSPFDVHINRSPIRGEVVKIEHRKGKFLQAFKPESALLNERTEMCLKSYDKIVKVIQIAGIIARRIICRAEIGEVLAQGEKYGIIHFGSRVEIIFPVCFLPSVQAGDKVKGGISILAKEEG